MNQHGYNHTIKNRRLAPARLIGLGNKNQYPFTAIGRERLPKVLPGQKHPM